MQQEQLTIVFRIQDKEGRGPWRPGFSHKWVLIRPDHDNLIPPYLEHKNFISTIKYDTSISNWGVGCLTLDQLRRWINKKEYKTLIKYGYKCVAIKDCKIIFSSDIQVVFKRNIPLRFNAETIRLY